MKRVTGIGGVFFKAKDPTTLRAWYKQHLGIDINEWGIAVFAPSPGKMAWSIDAPDAERYAPSQSPFIVNYRVEDLKALLAALREEGVQVLDETQESEFGKFGAIMDPEGHKIALWEPTPGR